MIRLLLFSFIAFSANSVLADDCACETCSGGLIEAQRAWQIATLEARMHRENHPRRMRALRDEREYAETRIAMLEELLDDYRTITRFRTGSALTVTSDRVRLELLREQQHLRELRLREREELRRHWAEKRLYAHQLELASLRLAHLAKKRQNDQSETTSSPLREPMAK